MGCQDLNRAKRAAPRRGSPGRDGSAEQKKRAARLMSGLVWVTRARARVGGGEHLVGRGRLAHCTDKWASAGFQPPSWVPVCNTRTTQSERTPVKCYASIQKNKVGIYLQIWEDVQNISREKARGNKFSLVRIPFLQT